MDFKMNVGARLCCARTRLWLREHLLLFYIKASPSGEAVTEGD